MEEQPLIVPPVVLTSILPFGLNDSGDAFRCSLCIDLFSNYLPVDVVVGGGQTKKVPTAPDPDKLRQFLYRYGLGDAIVEKIRNNIKVMINGSELSSKPCFTEFNGSAVYWDLLLPGIKSSDPGTWPAMRRGDPAPLAAETLNKTITSFNKNERPDIVVETLVGAIQRVRQEISASADGGQRHVTAAAIQDLRNAAATLENDIRHTESLLKGISSYADQKAATEGIIQLSNNLSFRSAFGGGSKPRGGVFNSEEAIRGVFSFISSNPVLQRLFATTIDFELPVKDVQRIVGKTDVFGITVSNKTDFNSFLQINGSPVVNWQHLTTSMEYIRTSKGDLLIVDRVDKNWFDQGGYFAANYDFGTKLRQTAALKEKLDSAHISIDTARTESERYKAYKDFISLESASLTRGMNVYNMNVEDEINRVLGAVSVKAGAGNAAELDLQGNILHEGQVTMGHRFGLLGAGSNIIPLGARKVQLVNKSGAPVTLPEIFATQEFSINWDSAMHALVETTDAAGVKNVNNVLVVDTAILTWNGENIGMPSIFSNKEDETNFEPDINEGSVPDAADQVNQAFLRIFKETYHPSGVRYSGSVDTAHGPVQLNGSDAAEVPMDITLRYSYDKNAKLLLGKFHQLCMVPKYKNGWGIGFNSRPLNGAKSGVAKQEPGYVDLPGYDARKKDQFINFLFKRNEPVKHVSFFPYDPLLRGDKAAPGREGESLYNLVIRNYAPRDDDRRHRTHQITQRWILPPAISFEHAFWHNKMFEMNADDSYEWYLKYHFPVLEKDKKPDGTSFSYEEAIRGSVRMRDYYQHFKKNEIINYLPDPLCRGFRFEFFLDRFRTIKAAEYEKYEQLEFYFSGQYPAIDAWKLTIEDEGDELLKVSKDEIIIRIARGRELYITARTILDESYEKLFETYGNYNDFTRYGNNDLLTPPLEFNVVHATQRPLVRPHINNTLISEKAPGKTAVRLVHSVHIEQLDTYDNDQGIVKYVEDTVPTGNIEFYAKWEEYTDDPSHLLEKDSMWTPEKPLNAIDLMHIGKGKNEESPAVFQAAVILDPENLANMEGSFVRMNDNDNKTMDLSVNLEIVYDMRETKYMEKWFWIRNKSKFGSYFPGNIESDVKAGGAEYFNRVSGAPFLVKILNNKKPLKPQLTSRNMIIVAVTEDIFGKKGTVRKASMNRLRFYFERGRLSSGKGERIGFVLNEMSSKYNDYFTGNEQASIVGKDAVSDSVKPYDGLYRSDRVFLQKSNFVVHDPYDLATEDGDKADDLEDFSPKYVEDLGIMTYLPKFDTRLNCWWMDIELDVNDPKGRELHCPFLRFSMVHYQEHSYNYNGSCDNPDLTLDCRISDVQNSGFIYLMGTRTLYVEPDDDTLWLTVSVDETAVIEQTTLKTFFYAAVQQRKKGDLKWITLAGRGGKGKAFSAVRPNTRTVVHFYKENVEREHRLVVLESEHYGKETHAIYEDELQLTEDYNQRIILTSVFMF